MNINLARSVSALAAAALVLTACSSAPSSLSGDELGGPSPSATPGTGGKTVTVLLDGWSAQTLANTTGGAITWEAFELPQGQVAEANLSPIDSGRLRLEPATADRAAQVAQDSPEVMTQILARTVTPAADLSCDAGECTSTHEVDLNWVDEPGLVPVFGEVYETYDISHLLYEATVRVPEATDEVVLSSNDVQSVSVEFPDGESSATVAVGYTLGSVFPLFSAWLENPDFWRVPGRVLATDPVTAQEVAEQEGLGLPFSGLAQVWDPASSLSASQLTFASSPTTGCGVLALCVPTVLEVDGVFDSSPAALCPAGEQGSATGGGELVLPVRVISGDVLVDLPGPTNLFGMNGLPADEGLIEVPELGGGSYGGLPSQLAEGELTASLATVLVLDPNGETVVDFAGFTDYVPGGASGIYEDEDWFFGGQVWRLCGADELSGDGLAPQS